MFCNAARRLVARCRRQRLGRSYLNRIALLTGCAVHAAVAGPPEHPVAPIRHTPYNYRYANAERRFNKALLYKPGPTDGLLSIELAPLIVMEVAPNKTKAPPAHSFGAVVLESSGTFDVDLSKPTVYFDERSLEIHGKTYTERVFAIYARPGDHGVNSGRLITVHFVLGADGFPLAGLVWNQWFKERRRPCGYAVFVSEELEQRARQRFGAPQPGCRYSIERGPRRACSPTVPGVFGAGPIPMGLYVYIDRSAIPTTLLCRCSPAQMNEVLDTRDYRLEPIERVLALRAASNDSRRNQCPIPPGAEQTARLIEQALRWPVEPATDTTRHEDR